MTLEVTKLTKAYGKNVVLDRLSLTLEGGHIHALVGENGAGKTTLLNTLAGIYRPDSGRVLLDGKPIFDNVQAKARIGFVTAGNTYPVGTSVAELAKQHACIYPKFDMNKWETLMERAKLTPDKSIRSYSRGEQMLISILLNLSICPDVLLLDEPFAGLDPVLRKIVFSLLVEESAEHGTTMLISLHDLSELERLCETVFFLKNGKIERGGSIDELKAEYKRIQAIFAGDAPDISEWRGVKAVERAGRVLRFVANELTDELREKLETAGAIAVEEIDLSLEEMFLHMNQSRWEGFR